MKKKVSIMIPCYNEEENIVAITDAVAAQMEQLPQYDYEIVVIDNCSKDNTRPLIREICAKNKKVKAIFPTFEEMPVAQVVTNTQGEEVLKNNPAMQEIRATFRDYCTIVKAQMSFISDKAPVVEVAQIDAIRQKLKIAK